MSESIYKVGAIILNDQKELLVVRKQFKDRVDFIIPGGRQEKGENDEQTLRRELEEELGVTVKSFTPFGQFEEMAVFENVPLKMTVFEVQIEGTPKAKSEIKEAIWIDANYAHKGIQLGSVLSKHVIPALFKQGKMK